MSLALPPARKILGIAKSLLGICFLLIGTFLLFVPENVVNSLLTGFSLSLSTPMKEIAGFIVMVAGIYLLFKEILEM